MIEAVLTPAPTVALVEVAGEGILVDEARDHLHHLNPTATLVWKCLDGDAPLAEICGDFAEVTGVPRDRVESEVAALAGFLVETGLATAPGYRRRIELEELNDPDHDCAAHDPGPAPCGCDDDEPGAVLSADGVPLVAGAPNP